MKRFAIALFTIIPALVSAAENYKDINVQHLSLSQGLSHYTVNSIWQDEFGFIWIGTMDGLNRYDGSRIEVFKPSMDDPQSIRENNIRYVCGDGNGHLYIRGLGSMSEYDMSTNSFRLICPKGVQAIAWGGGEERSDGKLWLSIDNTIFTYDRENDRLESHFSFEAQGIEAHVACFGVTPDGGIYLSTSRDGWWRINPRGEIMQHIPMGEANYMMQDSGGEIWVGTRNEGIYRIGTGGTYRRYIADGKPHSLNHNNVRHIVEDDAGNLWVGTFDGLSLLNRRTDQFMHYRYEFRRTAFNLRSILTMMRDRQGTLWIGTFYEGLQCYSTAWDVYRYYSPSTDIPGRLTSPIVGSVAEDRDGYLWIGTEGGGLNCLNRESGKFTSWRSDVIPSDVVKSLLYEPDTHSLWIATLYDGVACMDLTTKRIRNFENKIWHRGGDIGHAQNIVRMTRQGDSILMATNKGVVVLDRHSGRMTRLYTGFAPNRRAQIWDIEFDTQGDMWFTSSTDLLRVDPETSTTKRYTFGEISRSGLNNHLNCILCDSSGRLWFGSTGSGIYLYDPPTDTFRNFGTRHGLNNGYITGIVEAHGGGRLYVATNSGLSCFDPATGNFENYNVGTGFPLTTINENSLYITRNGEIFACGPGGMISVAQDDLKTSGRSYDVYVSDISVNNVRVTPGDDSRILSRSVLYQKQIRLTPRQNVITFHFTGTDFINPEADRLEYKLEGFDDHFTTAQENNRATYTNLNPGRYRFIVRGSNPGAVASSSLELTVVPPFWQSWWFVSLCSILILGLVWYFIRAYTQSVELHSSLESQKREKEHAEEVNQSKLRFFTNVSHEFRTPLMLIEAQLEMMLMKGNVRPSTYTRILSIYRNSQRMRRLVDEIIDLRKQDQGFMKLKVSRGDMVNFLHEIYFSFDDYAKQHGITYTYRHDAEQMEMWFDPIQMEKVVYNLLSNAFKYTPQGGSITLEAGIAGENVEITVTDSGCGINPGEIDKIFDRFWQSDDANNALTFKGSGVGLSLAKAIVEMHGGIISVRSEPGAGAVFSVILPLEASFDGQSVNMIESNSPKDVYIKDPNLDMEHIHESIPETDKRATMLIVEDNGEARELLAQIFEPVYDTYTAPDGKRGVDMARELQPDIILSDIMMPGLSGTEMCRKLKSDLETCHIPIVLLTARTAEDYVVEGLFTGADDYITKPFSVKLLVARCNNLVEGRRRLQQKYLHQPDARIEMLSVNPADQQLLSRAVDVVSRNIDNVKFDIQMFSREMALSRTYLFAKIKGLTGQTPGEFVLNIRLKKAVDALLSNPGASMSDIAYDLGFSSSSYFIKCFREMYGKTPNAYRKDNLEKNA